MEPWHALILLGTGFLVRVWLIESYPIIFGGDSIVRLVNSDRILLAYQLPLLQAAIHYLSFLSDDPDLVRYFMAVAGAAAGVGFYWMTSALFGRATAFFTALMFVTNPFVLAFSIVPYQEILMLAGLFFAFHFFFTEKWAAASFSLGLACLTRYEAWAACPVFVIAWVFRRPRRLMELAKGAVLFGWAPLGWLLYNAGLAPGGTFVVDPLIPAERLWRYVYLGWITVKNTPIPVLLLAGFGFWRFWSQGLLRSGRYRMLAGFLALFLIAILFSAHGERDQPDRFVTAREAHILLAAVTAAAGLGFAGLGRFRWIVLALAIPLGLFMAARFVARETSEPHLQLSYQLARYLDEQVSEHEQVFVLVRPIPKDLLDRFLDRSTRQGGAMARRNALGVLEQVDTSPPDYQRTLVHSRLGKEQLRNLASLPLGPEDAGQLPSEQARRSGSALPASPPGWIAVWSDFEPTNAAESRLQELVRDGTPAKVLEQDSLSVRIYKLGQS